MTSHSVGKLGGVTALHLLSGLSAIGEKGAWSETAGTTIPA